MAGPWILRHAIDDLKTEITPEKLWQYAGFLVTVAIAEGIFRYAMRMVLIGMSREMEFELRNDVFEHLTRLPASYYHSHRIGDVMSRATNDMSAVRMVLGPGIMYTANTIATFAGSVFLMFKISPLLLGLSLVPLFFVSFLVRHYGRQIHDRYEKVQEQLANINALVQENLSGARVVRAYAQEESEKRRFAEANLEHLRRNRELIKMFGVLYPGIQVLMGSGVLLVVWLGGGMVIRGTISLGEFVAFGAYLAMLHWPMIALGWVVNIFERGEASMGRIAEILNAAPEIRDESPLAVESIAGDVEFRNMTFGYGERTVLHDIDLHVRAGTTVAVVGPTGCGKSTLVSLIARLFDPLPGTLFVDGNDVRHIPLRALRAAIGFVPQETFLFSESVRENIGFGLPASVAAAAKAARVDWSAEVSQLAKDVADFPQGFETFVGERGITLSGGQKQRSSLARALAVDPKILILDDALSSVDTETEDQILRGLREVMKTRTTFLVSHRISTVKDADLIVVLREGRIVERGKHDALVKANGFYADLHRRQLLEEEFAQETA